MSKSNYTSNSRSGNVDFNYENKQFSLRLGSPRTLQAIQFLSMDPQTFTKQKQIQDFKTRTNNKEIQQMKYDQYLKNLNMQAFDVYTYRRQQIKYEVDKMDRLSRSLVCQNNSDGFRIKNRKNLDKLVDQKNQEFLLLGHTKTEYQESDLNCRRRSSKYFNQNLAQELRKFNREKNQKQKEALNLLNYETQRYNVDINSKIKMIRVEEQLGKQEKQKQQNLVQKKKYMADKQQKIERLKEDQIEKQKEIEKQRQERFKMAQQKQKDMEKERWKQFREMRKKTEERVVKAMNFLQEAEKEDLVYSQQIMSNLQTKLNQSQQYLEDKHRQTQQKLKDHSDNIQMNFQKSNDIKQSYTNKTFDRFTDKLVRSDRFLDNIQKTQQKVKDEKLKEKNKKIDIWNNRLQSIQDEKVNENEKVVLMRGQKEEQSLKYRLNREKQQQMKHELYDMRIEENLVNSKRIKNSHLQYNFQKFQQKSEKILLYNIDTENKRDFCQKTMLKSHTELKKNKDHIIKGVDKIHEIYAHNQKRKFTEKYKIRDHHKKKGLEYLLVSNASIIESMFDTDLHGEDVKKAFTEDPVIKRPDDKKKKEKERNQQ